MWKYIVIYWVVILGVSKTKNTQEFATKKDAIDFIEYAKKQNVVVLTGLKLDSIKIMK